jgi:hypothetical protein
MRKIIFIFLAIFLVQASFYGSQAKPVDDVTVNVEKISFAVGVTNPNDLTLFAESKKDDAGGTENILTQYYKLFFGLTIAFGIAAFTFLIMGIVFSAVYGVSNNLIRTSTNVDEINRWHDSQTGMLAGTIASWSLFTLFALCGTACGVILIIASDSGKNKLTKLEIKPSFEAVSVGVSFDL